MVTLAGFSSRVTLKSKQSDEINDSTDETDSSRNANERCIIGRVSKGCCAMDNLVI